MSNSNIIEDFNNTLNLLIQKIFLSIEHIIIEMHSLTSLLEKNNIKIDSIRDFLEKFKKNYMSNTGNTGQNLKVITSIEDFLTSYHWDTHEFYDSYKKLVESSTSFKESLKNSLTSIQKNINLITKSYEDESKKLMEENKSLQKTVSEIQAKNTSLLEEKKALNSKLEQLKLSYDSLNKQFNELEKNYTVSIEKISNLQKSNISLENNLKTVQDKFDRIKSSFNQLYNSFNRLPSNELKLPSYIIKKSVRPPPEVEQLETLFKNIELLIELDNSLLSSYSNSRAFSEALFNSNYTQILNQVFKNIMDIEDQEHNEIERKICEVEALANDPQHIRYIHTELFKPYIKAARTLLSTRQKKMGEAASQLIEKVKEKLENQELRKILIRRTGIRNTDIDECSIQSYEIPLETDNIDASLRNLVESLNDEIAERKRELVTMFFDSWRETALQLTGGGVEKIVAYIILLIT
ncbi:MAG: hypothetical protein QW739_02690, partial [Candidatus Odinarchaeota archaeon]